MNAIFRILNDYSFTRLVFFLTKIIYFSYRLINREIHRVFPNGPALCYNIFNKERNSREAAYERAQRAGA